MNPAVVGAVAGQMTPKERMVVIIGVSVIGVALVGVTVWKFNAIKNFTLDLFGAGKESNKKEKELAKLKEKALKLNGWKMNYYSNHNSELTISATEAGKLADSIYDGIGIIADKEEKIFAGLRACQTQADLSYICWQYYNKYKEDLYTQLTKNLNVSEQIEVFKITNKLL